MLRVATIPPPPNERHKKLKPRRCLHVQITFQFAKEESMLAISHLSKTYANASDEAFDVQRLRMFVL